MAIHTIEYFKPMPMEAALNTSSGAVLQRYFKKGWCEGRILGVGVHNNLLPKGYQRIFRDIIMPGQVHADGTATVAIRRELEHLVGGRRGRFIDLDAEDPLNEAIAGDRGVYRIIGIPETSHGFNFTSLRVEGGKMVCHGLLFFREGPSPEQDIKLRTLNEMYRASGLGL